MYCPGEDFFDLGGQEESASRPTTGKSTLEARTTSRPTSSAVGQPAETEEPVEPVDPTVEESIDDALAQILD